MFKGIRVILLCNIIFSFLFVFANEFSKPVLGQIVKIDGREYDTFYYFNGEPQYLKQQYDLISIPHSVNLNELNNIEYGDVPVSVLIKEVVYNEGHTKAHRINISHSDRNSWNNIANLLVSKGIPAWPVVTYYASNPLILDGTMGIMFSKYTPYEKRNEIFDMFDLEIVEISENDPEFFVVALPIGSNPFAIANKLVELDLVRWAQPNWFWHYELKRTTPNDEYFSKQWHLTQILADFGWDIETGEGKDAKISIVDSGVDTTHPDLNVLGGWNYIEKNSDPNPKTNDDAHGTACAGLAGAKTNNSAGVAGVCWGCPIIPIRLIGNVGLYPTTVKTALEFAVDQGAWVVSNSWGPQGKDNYGNCVSSPADNYQSSGVDYGRTKGRGGKGTVMLWAAGNDTCNTSYQAFLKDDDILVISAIDDKSTITYYSNFGKEVDLSAGAGNYTTDMQGSKGYNTTSGMDLSNRDYTKTFAGTSAATPVAAGAVALMIAANPNLDFSGIMNCAKASASKVSNACSQGSWSVQSDPWLASGSKEHSPCYGFGKIDVNAMVNGAKDGTCGECVVTAAIDLCYGNGYDRDDDCDGIVDNECDEGGQGKAGDACKNDDECLNTSSKAFCITDWKGGYCSAECNKNTDCYNSGSGVECYQNECIAQCKYNEVRSGYDCISNKILPEGTEILPYCGNGLREEGEACDGGSKNCNIIDSGFTGGVAFCREDCRGFDTSTCTGSPDLCGNNNVDPDEICDNETRPCSEFANTPPVGNVTCKKDCSGWDKSKCKEEGENSGDSGNSGDTGGNGDSGDTSDFSCGNGVLEVGEECDDGNLMDGDGCSQYCFKEKSKTAGGCSIIVF